jgi:phage virion morphogenesis protein
MAGFAQTFEWDDRQVQAMLKQMVRHVRDMDEPMDEFAQYMLNETTERFEKEESPAGQAWKKLSPITELARKKAGKSGKILQVDGILKNSIQAYTGKAEGGLMVDGSDLEYAAIHNFGGWAGPGRKVKIPKRQFVGVNDDDINEFKNIVADWVTLQEGRR